MKKLLYILLFVPFGLFGQNIEGYSYLGTFEGSIYYLSNQAVDWYEADSISNSIGGHLVTITSEEENNFITSLLSTGVPYFIGLFQNHNIENTTEPSGNWQWVTTEEFVYENWGDGEPNEDTPGEDFGSISPIAQVWNDAHSGSISGNGTTMNYILEINPDCSGSLELNCGDPSSNEPSIIDQLNQSFDAWNISIDLSAGWNMFGYGCPSSIDVAEGLSNHTESIIITKDNNGNVYMPEFGFNGIGDFTPGFGYQIKLTEAIEGFSLCDWYVNDIPEDNIVSLQEENASLQAELDSIYGCMDETACNYDVIAVLDDGSCEYPLNNYDCEGNIIEYFVGMEAEGGIVFYIDETGYHGMVAAMEDLTEDATIDGEGTPGYQWGCFAMWLSGADGQAIGTGYQNTLDIASGCSETPIAASETLAYQSENYSDWYLPSLDELKEMYYTIGNGGSEGNIGGFSSNWYWSSSESNNYGAYDVNFSDGSTGNFSSKTKIVRVRPIRSF